MKEFRKISIGVACAAVAPLAMAAAPMAATISAAVADTTRPAADSARDADRKPAAMLAFAQVRPGQTIADILPGGGYFTRLFSTAVGAKGKVYAVDYSFVMPPMPPRPGPARTPPPPVSGEAGHANVTEIKATPTSLGTPTPLDLAWTSENYHDLHAWTGSADAAMAFNKSVFAALKPGGLFVISDHVGMAGMTEDDIKKVHRIDPEQVKREVIAAGFVYDGESDATRNSTDPHTALIFDPSIRGKTDRFTLRFRKPK